MTEMIVSERTDGGEKGGSWVQRWGEKEGEPMGGEAVGRAVSVSLPSVKLKSLRRL
jgi:hypothetical protein